LLLQYKYNANYWVTQVYHCLNLLRFKSLSILFNLEFTGYSQRDFVYRNGYDQMKYHDILKLWSLTNTSINYLIKTLTEDQLNKKVASSVFDQISFKRPASSVDENLKFIITDYFHHLEHHIKQIQNIQNVS
jgi:hypothetical protein